MIPTEPADARVADGEEPFHFFECRARSFSTYAQFVVLGGCIVAPPIVGIFWPDSGFSPRADWHYIGIQLMLLGALGVAALLPAVIRNRVQEFVIDRAGIRYGGRSWTWDEIAWIGSTEHNLGGVWIAIRTRDKPERLVRLVHGLGGSPALSPAQFEQVMQRVEDWTLVHAPHVTIERTRTASDRKTERSWAGVSIAIGLAIGVFLIFLMARQKGRAALDNFRHPIAICVLFIAGTLFMIVDGVRKLRKK
ncbi:MAG TPA: hypothetical protein VL282_07465 [Tepidisphaeraceae bacterium]|nr:hypothetical protein [Tepidisphaeraceae bacterium]